MESQTVDGLGIAQIDLGRAGQRNILGIGGSHLIEVGDYALRGSLVILGGIGQDVGAVVAGEA